MLNIKFNNKHHTVALLPTVTYFSLTSSMRDGIVSFCFLWYSIDIFLRKRKW